MGGSFELEQQALRAFAERLTEARTRLIGRTSAEIGNVLAAQIGVLSGGEIAYDSKRIEKLRDEVMGVGGVSTGSGVVPALNSQLKALNGDVMAADVRYTNADLEAQRRAANDDVETVNATTRARNDDIRAADTVPVRADAGHGGMDERIHRPDGGAPSPGREV